MRKLLVLADDITGALDTGVQLTKAGAKTRVVTSLRANFDFSIDDDITVINTETRHMSPEDARDIIHKLAERASLCGADIIYKKTDSALRGNIGAELEGLIFGSRGKVVYFVPAFPDMGRYTINGVQLFNGVPIGETAYGSDPFTPLKTSSVEDILKEQTNIPVMIVREEEALSEPANTPVIMTFDSTNDGRIRDIARWLRGGRGEVPLLLSGCAGFGAFLSELLDLRLHESERMIPGESGVIVISGTLNPITTEQINAARTAGFGYIPLCPNDLVVASGSCAKREKLAEETMALFRDVRKVILDVNAEKHEISGNSSQAVADGRKIASWLGRLVGNIILAGFKGTLAVTGGDTLQGVVSENGGKDVVPICEIETGVVLCRACIGGQALNVVTKSGGFGSRDVFSNIYNFTKDHYDAASMT